MPQDLSKVASERLDTYREWIGIAVLRCYDVPAVPQGLQSEELNGKSPSTLPSSFPS